MYWYCKSKEEITFALVSDMLGRFPALLEEESDETMPVIERLSKRVSNHYYREKEHLRLLWKLRADQNYIFSPAYVEKVMSYNIRTRKPEKNVNRYSSETAYTNTEAAGYMRRNLINNQGA